MSASLKTVNYRNPSTPQTQKAAPGQKPNNGGGYSFVINDFERAKRFVILGVSEGFYQTGAKLAGDNAKGLIKVIEGGQSTELVDFIVDVSVNGRAAKQQPGLFALAVASSFGSDVEKGYALAQLNKVARTGTTLFEFVGFALQFRSWGRALKNAVANWYGDKDINSLAYQMVKYQSREGWSHGDLIKLTHPKGDVLSEGFNDLAKWSMGKVKFDRDSEHKLPSAVVGFELAKSAKNEKELLGVIDGYNLSWEMVPNDKRSETVWKALVNKGMPLGALLRQLPTLTRLGVLKPLSNELFTVVQALTDTEKIKKARLHPINILVAMKTYASGGAYSRGSHTWTPKQEILDALDEAFYKAFVTVEPSGKRFLLGVDVSPSMWGAKVNDSNLSSAEAVAALSLVIDKTEPRTHTVAFTSAGGGYSRSSGVQPLNISQSQRLDDVLKVMQSAQYSWGSTDCSLPMQYAMQNNIEVDTFVILTDNDTNRGSMHPFEALKQYRNKTGIPAKLAVLATYPSKFSIADPNDSGMIDISGFDTTVPMVLSEFSKN